MMLRRGLSSGTALPSVLRLIGPKTWGFLKKNQTLFKQNNKLNQGCRIRRFRSLDFTFEQLFPHFVAGEHFTSPSTESMDPRFGCLNKIVRKWREINYGRDYVEIFAQLNDIRQVNCPKRITIWTMKAKWITVKLW